MRIALPIFGVILFVSIVVMGYCLLDEGALSGSEFVSLIVSFAVIGLIIAFASEVQEFSVVGNIVKLKEVKRDAERSISELKAARTETFRFLLSLAKRHPGGLGGIGPVDERIPDFWVLHKQIEKFGCQDDLVDDLMDVSEILAKGQISTIGHLSDRVGTKYRGVDSLPLPSELLVEALDEESIAQAASRGLSGGDTRQLKEWLVEAIEEYTKLYELYRNYESKM